MLVSACIAAHAFLFSPYVGICLYCFLVHCLCWSLMQIECINDGIGMVYSGMGPDFRLVTDTSLLLLLLLLIPPSLLHYPYLLCNTVCMYSLCLVIQFLSLPISLVPV